jgi:hypothetical protein
MAATALDEGFFAFSRSGGFASGDRARREPDDDIVRGHWREAVVEKDAEGRQRINRITYEICVLEALREKLRCKEIWVVGADRYRNPDEDLRPTSRRSAYRIITC